MITIVAKNVFRAWALELIVPLLNELVEKSRQESGCRRYELFQAIDAGNVFIFLEEWADEKAFKNHEQSEHYMHIVAELGKYWDSAPEMLRYRKKSKGCV